ncbi:MAG: hypothetical protein WCX90_03975 [Thiohalomonadaceae bacterium]
MVLPVLAQATPAVEPMIDPVVDVEFPDLDIANSVRRRLGLVRADDGESNTAPVVTSIDKPTIASPAIVVPSSVPTATIKHVPATSLPSPQLRTRPQAPAAPVTEFSYVPLPAKELMIRDSDDIRALARELEEAKQRQRQGQTSVE